MILHFPLLAAALYLFCRNGSIFGRLRHAVGFSNPSNDAASAADNHTQKIGIANLGNTCYMNSVLQGLFASNLYRENLIHSQFKEGSTGKALQQLFARLGHVDSPSTDAIALANAMSIKVSVQEDAEEFMLKLIHEVDESSTGTDAASRISSTQLPSAAVQFNTEQTIECMNVDLTKRKSQTNLDLSVDIQDQDTLEEALRAHFTPELLTGDSQYNAGAENGGMQDAIKSLYLIPDSLPDTLIVHLKRFSFDPSTFEMCKIGNALDIPMEIDLKEFLALNGKTDTDSEVEEGYTTSSSSTSGSDSSSTSSSPIESVYDLSAVVIHEGALDFGHYYCLARTSTLPIYESNSISSKSNSSKSSKKKKRRKDSESSWVKLNDHVVSTVSEEQVLQLARGAPYRGIGAYGSSSSNAYLVFYTRRRH